MNEYYWQFARTLFALVGVASERGRSAFGRFGPDPAGGRRDRSRRRVGPSSGGLLLGAHRAQQEGRHVIAEADHAVVEIAVAAIAVAM